MDKLKASFWKLRILIGEWYRRLLTRTPYVCLQLVPGTSARWWAPRRVRPLPDYAREHRLPRITIHASSRGFLAEPFVCLPPGITFRDGADYFWPETGLTTFSDIIVAGPFGQVVGRQDTWLFQPSFYGDPRRQLAAFPIIPQKAQRLTGKTLNLCSHYGGWNYCHSLLDSLGRFALVKAAGIEVSSFDHVLLPSFKSSSVDEVIVRLGISPCQHVYLEKKTRFHCQELIQPDYPGTYECYAPWLVAFYRELFPAPSVEPWRRVYIPRHGRRKPTNDSAVNALMAEAGFEVFDPLAFSSIASLRGYLAEAKYIVSVHGAANANFVFCQPGARVLEIVPSDQRWRFYYSLCHAGGLSYGVIFAQSSKNRRLDRGVPSLHNITIDINHLRSSLKALLNG